MYGRWMLFRLEMKKYMAMVPAILAGTALVGLILFGIGFCASKAVYGEKAVGEIRVGIVADGQDNLTEMLIRFVESMDSVRDTVAFVRLSEAEAREALLEGVLSAAVLVPEGIVDSVNSGENIPATILLADDYSRAETEVFAQFTAAGAKLLTVAQAGIYAADALCIEEGRPESIGWLEDYLNRRYLDYAMGRSGFFKEVEVSAAAGIGMADYYGICLMLAFLSFAALSFGKSMRTQGGDREKMLAARGLGRGTGYIADAAAFGCVFAFFGTITGLPLYLLLSKGKLIFSGNLFSGTAAQLEESSFVIGADWLWMWLLWFAIGVFIRFLIQAAGNHAGGISLAFGILMAFMLASGVFIPSAFLPLWVERAGNIFPYRSWIRILRAVLQGDFEVKLAAELLLQILLFALAGVLAAILRDSAEKWRILPKRDLGGGLDKHYQRKAGRGEGIFGRSGSAIFARRLQKAQICGILWKEYFLKFRLWLILGVLAALFMGISGASYGDASDGQKYRGIEVGICTSDEKGKELLSGLMKGEGIFRFQEYEDEGEMLREIKNGGLECGYFLPEGFYEKLVRGKMKRQAILYRSPASSVHRISEEVVFAELFEILSRDILADYLQESGYGEKEGMTESGLDARRTRLYELNDRYGKDGSTFHFVYEAGKGETQKEPESLNIMRGLIAVMIFLMSLLGFANVLEQKEVWFAMPGISGRRLKAGSIHIAIMGSVCFGGVCLYLTGNMKEPGKELAGLLVYFLALEIFITILKLSVRESGRLYGLLPTLVLGSCLFCPVFIRIERYLPILKWIGAAFPPSYYLRLF